MSTVFYSWQSDLPNSTNRGFIQKALENAAKAIRTDESVEVEPVIDRDTQGVAGSPNIAETILEKIKAAHVFVCDVSIINLEMIEMLKEKDLIDDLKTKPRPTPNPNVLLELGYAMDALTLSDKQIVMVMNTAYGGPGLLPFDLKMNRIVTYHNSAESKDRATERRKLQKILEKALRTIFAEINGQPDFRDPTEVYQQAVELARNNDRLGWRQLEKQVRPLVRTSLESWLEKYSQDPPSDLESRHAAVDEAIEGLAPRFSLALVGVESMLEGFADQRDVFQEIYPLDGWPEEGNKVIVELPHTLGYVYQALYGAICLHTGQIQPAIRLANKKVYSASIGTTLPMWQVSKIIGWPGSLGGDRDATKAWDFLTTAFERWIWLHALFGDESEYRAALSAYYMALNTHELAAHIADGNEEKLENPNSSIRLKVPPFFVGENRLVQQRAFSLLISDPEAVAHLWEDKGVQRPLMESHWPRWIALSQKWWSSSYPRFFFEALHARLFEMLG